MKLILNQEFPELNDFIRCLPDSFGKGGETIYKARNEVKVFDVNNTLVNAKKYRVPIFINRIIYTYFRKSKAERAYRNALRILDAGIGTPTPVGFLLLKKNGLLSESFFVSLQSAYSRKFTEYAGKENLSVDDVKIITALGEYIARMHEKKILHLDLSVGNILFEATPQNISFAIVDLNRMKFRSINMELGCKNFERLRGSDEFFTIIAKAYAKARGFDEDKCIALIKKYNAEHVIKFRRHREFKNKIRRGK